MVPTKTPGMTRVAYTCQICGNTGNLNASSFAWVSQGRQCWLVPWANCSAGVLALKVSTRCSQYSLQHFAGQLQPRHQPSSFPATLSESIARVAASELE